MMNAKDHWHRELAHCPVSRRLVGHAISLRSNNQEYGGHLPNAEDIKTDRSALRSSSHHHNTLA